MPPLPLYRGRLAPSPTGLLHAGHARTFRVAHRRARERNGDVVLRVEDLDAERCRPEFRESLLEDLRWLGCDWDEGPILQSERIFLYEAAWDRLRSAGTIYPCVCSRREVMHALGAPHAGDEEPVYPGTCRDASADVARAGVNWRFRVPEGDVLDFIDGCAGQQSAVAGVDFGDFLVWRRDDVPAYQLAVVVDDAEMRISEVVRGADLLTSTFRQLLLYRTLDLAVPDFFHASLVCDAAGQRLAKRDDSLSVRALRAQGWTPEMVREWPPAHPAPTGR